MLAQSMRPLVARIGAQVPMRSAPLARVVSQPRWFSVATSPLETAAKRYEDFVDKSVAAYESAKGSVGACFDAELAANKVVLFMEGTPDSPKSVPSMNVVKMLTEAQAVPLLAVDVLAHPAILGYSVSKSGKRRGPHLYVNGRFYGDHDSLLAQHLSGNLAKELGSTTTRSTGSAFGGELPIATYCASRREQ
eukprot:TRINITY_DN82_c0_g1_i1.p1 TRINITY_DN82_c0_g1~~TRINITY_DN82_c0_g1_i1.p1  ORF type:complete len:216 (-),score=31.90 TRINITY_DN82_c0_g1_i1:142-717(-)